MLPIRALALAGVASLSVSAAPVKQCEPAPVVAPTPGLASNSTYTNDGEPPKRFSGPPTRTMQIRFGQAYIDQLCGRPPCGYVFKGCARGDQMAVPDPFATDSRRLTVTEIIFLAASAALCVLAYLALDRLLDWFGSEH